MLLLVLPRFSAGQETAADSHLQEIFAQAQEAQQRGDYRSAAKSYEEISKLRPEIAEVWSNLGLMHQFLGEYSPADQAFRTALTKNSRLYVPNLFLGLNQIRAGQYANAQHYLKQAVVLNPRDEQAAMGLARAYSGVKNHESAAKWFESAAQINPRDPEAWYGLGASYLALQDDAVVQLAQLNRDDVHARVLVADSFVEQGRTSDAIKIYQQFRSVPQPPCLAAELGFAYAQQGAAAQAREVFLDDIKDHPGCLLAHLGLARLALSGGDFDGMLREMHAAFDADANFVGANAQQVWRGVNPEQLTKAEAWLRQSSPASGRLSAWVADSIESGKSDVALIPAAEPQGPASKSGQESPDRLWTKGRYSQCAEKLQQQKTRPSPSQRSLLEQCSFYAGQYQLSLHTSESALRINPRDFASLYWKAKAAAQLATGALTQMSAADPGSPKVHLLLAELHRAREEFGAAETEYREVLRSGENVSARLGLAHVYYENSEDDKALDQLQLVIKANSTNPEANSLFGEILVRRHRYDEAVPHLTAALSGPPLFLPEVHSLLAKCYFAQGDYARALEEVKPALPADTMGTYYYQLYQIYQKLGNRDAAAAALHKSEQLRRDKLQAEQRQRLPTAP